MERRKSHRFKTDKVVQGRIPATPVLVTVLDLSTSGCMLRYDGPPIRPGTSILLDLSELSEVAGQVIWRDTQLLGVQFDQDLTADAVVRMVAKDVDHFDQHTALKDRFGRTLPGLRAHLRSGPGS